MLTEQQALEIFSQRPERALDKSGQYIFQADCSANATMLGHKYNIASKTIRDIWNRKSWVRATRPAWTPEEIAASEERPETSSSVIPAQTRKRGRPSGAKDTFPRVRSCKKRQTSAATSPSQGSVSSLHDGQNRSPDYVPPGATGNIDASWLKAAQLKLSPVSDQGATTPVSHGTPSNDLLSTLLQNLQAQSSFPANPPSFLSQLSTAKSSQPFFATTQNSLQSQLLASQQRLESLLHAPASQQSLNFPLVGFPRANSNLPLGGLTGLAGFSSFPLSSSVFQMTPMA